MIPSAPPCRPVVKKIEVTCFYCGSIASFNPARSENDQPNCKNCGGNKKVFKRTVVDHIKPPDPPPCRRVK